MRASVRARVRTRETRGGREGRGPEKAVVDEAHIRQKDERRADRQPPEQTTRGGRARARGYGSKPKPTRQGRSPPSGSSILVSEWVKRSQSTHSDPIKLERKSWLAYTSDVYDVL